MAPKGIELFSRPRFGFTSSSFVYQRDRLPLSYKLHKFFLPKLTHVVVVSFIVVVVYMQSDSLKEDRMLFWIFMALHSMTMVSTGSFKRILWENTVSFNIFGDFDSCILPSSALIYKTLIFPTPLVGGGTIYSIGFFCSDNFGRSIYSS